MNRPDFSPFMLAFFLRARAANTYVSQPASVSFQTFARRERARWRKLAKLTLAEIDFAWLGRLNNGAKRARLWAVLGHFPADHGIVLDDCGGQHGSH